MAGNTTRLKHTTGIEGISAVLQQLPADVRAHILTEGVKAGAQPIKIAAKRYARRSRDTGALEASIDAIQKNYPRNSTAVAVIGPTKDRFIGKRKLGRNESKAGSEQPSRRAHLIEFGHHTRKDGPSTAKRKTQKMQFVTPQPFMRPALLTTQPEVARRTAEGIAKGIEKTRRRLVKSGAHSVK